MTSAPEILIHVLPSGQVVHTVNGAVGTQCDALTKPLEDALGTVENRDNKPEYYEGSEQATQSLTINL